MLTRNSKKYRYSNINADFESVNEETSRNIICPTCEGSGKISKDSEAEYIALIPLKDKRLQPKRVMLKVIFAVVICIIFSSLLIFFLFPRPIIIYKNDTYMYPNSSVIIRSQLFSLINITFEDIFRFDNRNFIPLTINMISVDFTMNEKSYNVYNNSFDKTIQMRSYHKINYGGTIIIPDQPEQALMCTKPQFYTHSIFVLYGIRVQFQILFQQMESLTHGGFLMNCEPTSNQTTSDPPSL